MVAGSWLEVDTRFIPAHWQPVALLELLEMRGADAERVLRGTGIFRQDIGSGDLSISPGQYDRLLANAARALPDPEISFLYGERLFPGHFGDLTLMLLNAGNLYQAVSLLRDQAVHLTPLLCPRFYVEADTLEIVWHFGFGACASERFLLESVVSGWLSYCKWLAPTRLPWRVDFSFSPSKDPAHYQAHLGETPSFNQPFNRLVISADFLHGAWSRASGTAFQIAEKQYREKALPLAGEGFVGLVSDLIRERIREQAAGPFSLADIADAFGMSTATFKRKLQKHGTSFQRMLDDARKQTAIHLITRRGMNNQEVASYLHFHDVRNFRRAFKRWTGLTPTAIKYC